MRVTVILCVGLGGIMGWEEGVGGRSYKAVAIRAGVPLAEHGFHHCGLTLGGRLGHILKEGGWEGRSSRGGRGPQGGVGGAQGEAVHNSFIREQKPSPVIAEHTPLKASGDKKGF